MINFPFPYEAHCELNANSLMNKLQKPPQLNIHADRLNEAFFIARRVVATRSSQSAGNLIPRPVVDIH